MTPHLDLQDGKAGVGVVKRDALYVTGERFAVSDGEWVRIRSRRGDLEGRVVYTDKMRAGEIFVPFVKLQEHAANFLTNAALDPDSRIPEYKVCAVRVEKLDEDRGRRARRRDRQLPASAL